MNEIAFERRLLGPRFWPMWFAVLLLFLLARLPWFLQLNIGRFLGWLSWHLIPQRRSDALVNLRLCFPEKTEAEHQAMARDTFRQGGIGLLETLNAWFVPAEHYRQRIHIQGLEHIRAAEAEGRGVLLLGAHYSQMDFGGSLCSLYFTVDTVYRPQNNPVLEYVVRRCRVRLYRWQIDHDNMRGLVRAFKNGHIVWYTPDQDFGLKQGVFAPFFGVEAATITATSRLARVNNSVVMFVHFYRKADNKNYDILLTPPLQNYPSGDDVADATRVNQELEKLIRRAPTQYMWFHRRFKTRPEGAPGLYVKKRRQIREERELAEAAARAAEKDGAGKSE